jgi:cellulose synthase/poly-beta-1,6-N-acetylglucosamine synthase-like glycosyltransferase
MNPEAVFWIAVTAVLYAYVGYGVLVCVAAWIRPRPVASAPIRPTVTVVVVAHNEASRITERIESLLAMDYPRDRIDIIVAVDGSTDDTADRARRFEPHVRVVAFPARRGKPAVLDDVVPTARGEIVILADARQWFDPGAAAALVESFADPAVGAVSGELFLLNEGEHAAAVDGTAVYWDYEKRIRRSESRIDSTVGVTGAICAIRRTLFEPIPPTTLLDDVIIPLRIARRGYRVVFESRARAYDRRAATARDEFTRKVRTMAGNFQMFARERWLLSPWQNPLWLQTLSHKGLRLVLPLVYATIVFSNLLLLTEALYRWTMAMEVAFFATALTSHVFPAIRKTIPFVVVPYAICFLTWATVVGFVRFVTGRQRVTWDRGTPSGATASGATP